MNILEFISKKEAQFLVNNIIKVKDIGREGNVFFIREAYTFLPQTNHSDKVFIFERLRKEKTEGTISLPNWNKGDIEYRIGYFIKGKIGKANDRWVWGQFCPLIPQEDLNRLLEKAKAEKTLV